MPIFPDLNKKLLETILGGLKDDKIKENINGKLNEALKNKLSQHLPADSKLFNHVKKLNISDILNHKDSTVKEFFEKELAPSIKETDEVLKNTYKDFLNNVTDAEKSFMDFLGLGDLLKSCQPEKEKNDLKVSGTIVTNTGVAAKGLKVIAVDKNLGKDNVLGEGPIDSSGNYTISYMHEFLQKIGKQNPDIEIKVVDHDGSKIYGVSSVHYNADYDEKINLVLNTGSVEKTPEYNLIISDLKQCVSDGLFKNLQENKERQDISYLANKTGWDARLVAMVSLADKFSADSGILADFYYALFRAGLPTDNKLYQTNSTTVQGIWETAMEGKIIDASLKPKIEQNLATFNKSRACLLEKTTPVGVSSLKDLLDISLPDKSKQQKFVDLYFNHVGKMSEFWANAEKNFGKDTADQLQLDGKLGYLTANNAKLVSNLRNLVKKSPADLIEHGLYKNDAPKWDVVLTDEVSIPNDIPGGTPDEKRQNYINNMVLLLKTSYPTLVVADMVKNDDLKIAEVADMAKNDKIKIAEVADVKNKVIAFLKDNYDKFQIGIQPLEKILKDNKIEPETKVLKELKRLERIYQISPSDHAMTILCANNLDSAHAVVQYGEKEFIGKFANDLKGEEVAKMVYAKAHQVHSTVLNVAISYLTYRKSPNLYAISGLRK